MRSRFHHGEMDHLLLRRLPGRYFLAALVGFCAFALVIPAQGAEDVNVISEAWSQVEIDTLLADTAITATKTSGIYDRLGPLGTNIVHMRATNEWIANYLGTHEYASGTYNSFLATPVYMAQYGSAYGSYYPYEQPLSVFKYLRDDLQKQSVFKTADGENLLTKILEALEAGEGETAASYLSDVLANSTTLNSDIQLLLAGINEIQSATQATDSNTENQSFQLDEIRATLLSLDSELATASAAIALTKTYAESINESVGTMLQLMNSAAADRRYYDAATDQDYSVFKRPNGDNLLTEIANAFVRDDGRKFCELITDVIDNTGDIKTDTGVIIARLEDVRDTISPDGQNKLDSIIAELQEIALKEVTVIVDTDPDMFLGQIDQTLWEINSKLTFDDSAPGVVPGGAPAAPAAPAAPPAWASSLVPGPATNPTTEVAAQVTTSTDEKQYAIDAALATTIPESGTLSAPVWTFTFPTGALFSHFGGGGGDLTVTVDHSFYTDNVKATISTIMIAFFTITQSLLTIEEFRKQ